MFKQTLLVAVLVAAAPHAATAATIDGIINYSTTFAGVGLAFESVAPAGSTTQDAGTAVGPNVTSSLSATSGSSVADTYANVSMDITAGAGSSVNNALAEAFSGAVRITNTSTVNSFVNFNQTLLYSIVSSGPGTQGMNYVSAIQRWNPTTQAWDAIGGTFFSIGSNDSRTACSPACVGTSSYSVLAGQSYDVRLWSRLRGFVSQPVGVPEPGTFAMLLAGLAGLGVSARRSSARK